MLLPIFVNFLPAAILCDVAMDAIHGALLIDHLVLLKVLLCILNLSTLLLGLLTMLTPTVGLTSFPRLNLLSFVDESIFASASVLCHELQKSSLTFLVIKILIIAEILFFIINFVVVNVLFRVRTRDIA